MSDEPIIGRVEARESPQPPPLPAYILLECRPDWEASASGWSAEAFTALRSAEMAADRSREYGYHTVLIRLDAPAPERAPVLDVERARRIIPTLRDESRGPQGGGE